MDNETKYIFMKDRIDWQDVKPIPFECNDLDICKIMYSDEFKDIYGYYKAILSSGEKSERAFKLTTELLEYNIANYSLWSYRRILLYHLEKDLKIELKYVSNQIENDPKVYQLWYHRMELIKLLDDPRGEFDFCDLILMQDSKNYHTWQYRYWLLEYFVLWEQEREMIMIEKMLLEDPFNNSVWHHRYQVIKHRGGFENTKILEEEIEYTLNKNLKQNITNECAWNYLNGIFKFLQEEETRIIVEEFEKTLHKVFGEFNEIKEKEHRLMLDFITHYYYNNIENLTEEGITKAINYCEKLANFIDPVRKGYWEFLKSQIKAMQK